MDKEKLIAKIMKECAQNGEPVTREEAEEMAEMEIKANGIKHYHQTKKGNQKTWKELNSRVMYWQKMKSKLWRRF